MENLNIVSSGIRVDGDSYILGQLVASQIRSGHGLPLEIQSAKKIKIIILDDNNNVRTTFILGKHDTLNK